uniref:Uncharacterized protein n=1 Tax=Trieres chinensis TaxID=1514140 RepID=A0A7S2EAM9_TRICV|mmetsp:Transcript_1525/g.3251  ORF Transcript_1525/g.3251 Transcript_1525/m.3251 type:complete len:293 (+) Transcript_1525:647-1525(+)
MIYHQVRTVVGSQSKECPSTKWHTIYFLPYLQFATNCHTLIAILLSLISANTITKKMDFRNWYKTDGASYHVGEHNTTAPMTVPGTTCVAVQEESSMYASSKSYDRSKPSNYGRKGDPRMHRAVAAKKKYPKMTLLDALLAGGFSFPMLGVSGMTDCTLRDTDNVLLYQRKNQLHRRLRLDKKRATKENLNTCAKVGKGKLLTLERSNTRHEHLPDSLDNKESSTKELLPNTVDRNGEDLLENSFVDDFSTIEPEMLQGDYQESMQPTGGTLDYHAMLLEPFNFDGEMAIWF